MLLRASGEKDGIDYDTAAVTAEQADSGVPHSNWLRALTEAAIHGRFDDLTALRHNAAEAMGEQQMTDALTVAAAFNGITRVADATGIPLDENTAVTTTSLRASTGIDEFDYERKSSRYPGSSRPGVV